MQTTPRQKALAACILIVVAVAIFVAAPDGADSPEPGRQVEASPSPAVATTAEAESVDRGGDREDAVLANPDTSLNAVSTVAVSAPEARVSGEADSPAPRLPANPTADGAGEVPTEAETPVRTPSVAATDVLVLAPGADEPSRLRLESVEDAEAITVELRRTEDIEQPLAVEIMPISREDGLTNAGNLAFTLVEPVVRFAPGRASQRLTIRLPDDELLTGTRRYSFYVAQVSPVPAVLGRIDVAVRDDELIDRAAGLPFGSLSFAYAPDTVSESASDVRIRLLRYGDKRRAFAAKVLIAGVGAIEGEDYVGPSDQIVRFAPGSDTETIFVPLIDDDVAEPEEGLRLALDLPAERRVSPAALYIRIVDDD